MFQESRFIFRSGPDAPEPQIFSEKPENPGEKPESSDAEATELFQMLEELDADHADFDTTEDPNELPTAPASNLNYSPERLARYATIARDLPGSHQRMLSTDFAANPNAYTDSQVVDFVVAYQERAGLAQDGIIGPNTSGALERGTEYIDSMEQAIASISEQTAAILGSAAASSDMPAPDTPRFAQAREEAAEAIADLQTTEELIDQVDSVSAPESIRDRGVLPFLTNPDGTPRTNLFGNLPERSVDISQQATLDSSDPRIPSRQEMESVMDEDSLEVVDRIRDNLSEGPTDQSG